MRPLSETDADLRGALWSIVSCLGATGMSVAVRVLTPDLHSVFLAFVRSVLAAWILIPLMITGGWRRLRFTQWPMHLIRGALLAGALNCGFYALWKLPLATATTLFFLAPAFATVLSAAFAGEKVRARRWAATIAGFVGALIVLRPGLVAFNPAMLAAIGSSLMFAASLIASRKAAAVDGTESVMLSSNLIAAVLMFPFAIPHLAAPSAYQWLWIAILVGASSLRMYADIRAYALADAGFLAPFAYIRLLFVGLAGWWLFDERIDGPTLLGAAVILGAAVFIARREAQVKRENGERPTPLKPDARLQ